MQETQHLGRRLDTPTPSTDNTPLDKTVPPDNIIPLSNPLILLAASPFDNTMPHPQMPPPIILPREPLPSLSCILALFNSTKILLGLRVDVVDMSIDIFCGFKAPLAVWALDGMDMGFEMTAAVVLATRLGR